MISESSLATAQDLALAVTRAQTLLNNAMMKATLHGIVVQAEVGYIGTRSGGAPCVEVAVMLKLDGGA